MESATSRSKTTSRTASKCHYQIVEADFPFLSQDAGFYFNELKENYERIINALDNFKENMAGIIELQMSLKSDRTNDIMKTLTLIKCDIFADVFYRRFLRHEFYKYA
ncbi:CorA family divalent cation transporter [Gottfriedia acidiceleris]|uniref:CorA family divalent cation transporter n=1 Tax=Gottfriedia acidiceleris TaxID=371036 RepID=UPI00143054D7